MRSFGMWVPNTDPAGSGLIADRRFRGQEGAGDNAPMHSQLGVLGVTGFLMQNLSANPLDYVEGGPLNKRREQISEWLDSTNPDLSDFYRRGGKMIVTIGTDDTLASPGRNSITTRPCSTRWAGTGWTRSRGSSSFLRWATV